MVTQKAGRILFLAGAIGGLAATTRANPLFPDLYGFKDDVGLLALAALSALLIEYLVIRRLLHPRVGIRRGLGAFLWINGVTFSITHVLGCGFSWFAELFPLGVEPWMYRKGLGEAGRGVRWLGTRVVVANLVSFVVGLAYYYGIAWLKGVNVLSPAELLVGAVGIG